jgi:hypothetical protein
MMVEVLPSDLGLPLKARTRIGSSIPRLDGVAGFAIHLSGADLDVATNLERCIMFAVAAEPVIYVSLMGRGTS